MNTKRMLVTVAAMMMIGGLAASKSFAATQCWVSSFTWGNNFNISCSEGSSTLTGTVGSSITNGNRNIAAQMTSASVASNQFARVSGVGLGSDGNPITSCITPWDTTVNGASVVNTTGCVNARFMRGYGRISLKTTTDDNFPIPFP